MDQDGRDRRRFTKDDASTQAVSQDARPGDITSLLTRYSKGDEEALARMMPMVYDELRRIARRHMRGENSSHLLQGTSLVHEVYLKLADQGPTQWESRAHFFGWASTLMRHILVDHARARRASKRGGGVELLSLDALQENGGPLPGTFAPTTDDAADLLAFDQALSRLERLDPRQGRVVELRYFCALSVAETAEALGISIATVKRESITARAWLLRELNRLKDVK